MFEYAMKTSPLQLTMFTYIYTKTQETGLSSSSSWRPFHTLGWRKFCTFFMRLLVYKSRSGSFAVEGFFQTPNMT